MPHGRVYDVPFCNCNLIRRLNCYTLTRWASMKHDLFSLPPRNSNNSTRSSIHRFNHLITLFAGALVIAVCAWVVEPHSAFAATDCTGGIIQPVDHNSDGTISDD